jgi:hypothetical protein
MTHTSKIIWSLVWALATIATPFVFKSNQARYWIESALLVGALAFVILKSLPVRLPSSGPDIPRLNR